ncbi:MAG TPA: excinuclease ABC subunit B, partial [Desulfobacterales bacterium]|nr:excinuclease ABC subunit B [Desulfobacterales bacterium]
KEGFLRSERSLIQTCGRAARHVNGEVFLYADRVTPSMQAALKETQRRRQRQRAYNRQHGITPTTIQKGIQDILASVYEKDYVTVAAAQEEPAPYLLPQDIPRHLARLKKEMQAAAKKLEFERAAELRDRIKSLESVERR